MEKEGRLVCNACGKGLRTENGILKEDIFEGRKEWGFFSNKDMVRHSFLLCEACYDRITSSFAIPPAEEEVTEL